jgi:hypothetical protein
VIILQFDNASAAGNSLRNRYGVPCATISLQGYFGDWLLHDTAIWSANVGDRKQQYYELFRNEYQRRQLSGR